MASDIKERLIKEISELTLLQVADLVKGLEEKFGVSAAMPMAAAGVAVAGEAPAVVEEKSEFKVTLQDSGADKIKVIKAVKQVTSLSLIEAKKAVEGAPTVLAESASKEDAQKMKEALEAAGAKVQLS